MGFNVLRCRPEMLGTKQQQPYKEAGDNIDFLLLLLPTGVYQIKTLKFCFKLLFLQFCLNSATVPFEDVLSYTKQPTIIFEDVPLVELDSQYR